jgi:hypothetical protein
VPIEELVHGAASESDIPRLYAYGHELFADAFAAITVGPAYTRYCVQYRFDPREAQEVTAKHPAPVRRVKVQLEALRLVATGRQKPFITAEVESLQTAWEAAVQAAGGDASVPQDALLDRLQEGVIALLDDDKLVALRYGEQVNARRLAEKSLARAASAGSVAEALNAAWVRRLRNGPTESVEAIASACERLVGKVLGRG